MTHPFLTALPVFNEAAHVAAVLAEVQRHSPQVLVVDDGSSDGTSDILSGLSGIEVVRHARNRGYGAALQTAFQYAINHDYEVLVTIDCDGQHEPQRIPKFVAACSNPELAVDIVSGSRYLQEYEGDSKPPVDRQRINQQITEEINQLLGFHLTDAFCGFKAYRVSALKQLTIKEDGYGMPLELWVEAAHAGLSVLELPVPLIYLDEKRSFGGSLDDARKRLDYYHEVIERALQRTGFPWRTGGNQAKRKASCSEPRG